VDMLEKPEEEDKIRYNVSLLVFAV